MSWYPLAPMARASGLRAQLPARYRYLLPLADPVLGRGLALSLFRSAAGH